MKLNKRSSQPLYAQLKGLLVERIESGQYHPGEKIPSELDLCRELDLSRPTVRQAISEMVNEGFLQIIKGKGTYVTADNERIELKNFTPFTFSLLAAKSLDGYGELSVNSQEGDPDTDQMFAITGGAGHPGYWSVSWTIADDDNIIALCQSLVPVYMFPDLGHDLRSGRRMIDITANKYAYLPQKATAQLSVRSPNSREVQLLDIDRTVSILVAGCRLTSRSGHCCEVVQTSLRADLVTLSLDAGRS